MTRATRRRLLRKLGAIDDKTGKPIKVEAGKRRKVPMMYKGTQILVNVAEGQLINPEKEYKRQLGIKRK